MIQRMHDRIVCLSLCTVGVELLRHSPMPHDVAWVATRLCALHIVKLRLREDIALECNCQRRGAYQTLHVVHTGHEILQHGRANGAFASFFLCLLT